MQGFEKALAVHTEAGTSDQTTFTVHTQYKSAPRARGSLQKKYTGLFGDFSQTSDPPPRPPPPFRERFVQNEIFWVICEKFSLFFG